MPKFGSLGKFFGNTVSEGAAYAAGVATAPTLSPILETVRQTAWHTDPTRLPDVTTLANGVAAGHIDPKVAADWAQKDGFSGSTFNQLVTIASHGPGIPPAFEFWRRGIINEAGFRRAAKRQGLEQEWIDDLVKIKIDVLDPAQLAAAIHRGLVPDPGLLRGEQPTAPFNVEAYPVYNIDALAEALASGYDHDRLGVLVGLQGLPMGTHEAAQAYFKGILTHGDYIRAFNESNSRNEWAQFVLDNTRQIPTARDFMENALRGHHDFEWAAQQAARHGMSKDDAFLIYQNQGRPLNLHQISQAIAWGANYNPGSGDNPDPWMQAVLLGAVRPEYYEMQDSLKYIVPSAFALRTLQQNGAITRDEAATWYKRLGWEPTLSEKVADAFSKSTTGAAKTVTVSDIQALYDSKKWTRDEAVTALESQGYSATDAGLKLDVLAAREITSARDKAVTAAHKYYMAEIVTTAEATAMLRALGLDDATIEAVLAIWHIEFQYGTSPPKEHT